MIDDIPHDLRVLAHWLTWRYENRDDKQTKIPHDPKNSNFASVIDPTTWASFERSLEALATNQYSGLGFVLTKEAGYTFIDLDIKDGMAQVNLDRMISIQQKFDTYSERSPGGRGLHLICKGTVPRGRKRGGVEVYSEKRFMTVTGDVYENKPIADRQELLNVLWAEMGVGTPVYGDVDCPQSIEDGEVLKRATEAANGSKFVGLFQGKWSEAGYQSQSEADFALVDMISFYSQNREQIQRVFRTSELGKRGKALRVDYMDMMVNRSFDRMLPPPNIENLQKLMDDALAAQAHVKKNGATTTFAIAPVPRSPTSDIVPTLCDAIVTKKNGATIANYSATVAPPRTLTESSIADNAQLTDEQSTIKFPPGLMGDIANFIYQSSPRPVPEIALCAAIGLMAGLCGRAYNTPTGAGLNLFLLLVALSGTGKEGMATGISRLIEACSRLSPGDSKVPAIKEFIGPSEFRSDAALIKSVERNPSMVSIQGEFGLKLKAMHAPHAASHVAGLKTVYLELYSKSGQASVYRPMVYSDQSKDTHEIIAPAFSLLAETTPSTFYDAVDEAMVVHGLLPRFLVIEYIGKRVASNHLHNTIKPSPTLLRDLTALANHAHTMMHNGRAIDVLFADDATFQVANQFDLFCDDKINDHDHEGIRDLWNRGHLKTLKLASLVSVGLDSFHPVITIDAWRWAQELVQADIERVAGRFERGEVGSQINNERKQSDMIVSTMLEFLKRPWSEVSKYKAGEPAMQKYRIVPHSFILRKLTAHTLFKSQQGGATNAIVRTLKSLTESGIIREVTNSLSPDTKAALSYGGKLYMITDMRYL